MISSSTNDSLRSSKILENVKSCVKQISLGNFTVIRFLQK